MSALIDACKKDTYPAYISCVVASREDAAGLKVAETVKIPTHIVSPKHFSSKSQFEQALLDIVYEYSPDLICLAGFMHILSADFLSQLKCLIINIHPSLLPKYKGLDTHHRALNAGDKISGCSVHYVTPNIDDGEIVLQKQVLISPSDTPESLAQKVLEQEHIAYPEAVKLIAEKELEKQTT